MSDGTLLFQRGQGYAAEMWDDSELVAAWNRQQSNQGTTSARDALDRTRDAAEAEASACDSAASSQNQESQKTAGALRPPVPDWADEATAKLLQAWFDAGYWSGVKAAGASR
jgi:hypothetical protein